MKTSHPTVERKVTTGTREWADHNVNCVIGCANNCRYCYAKLMARRFRRPIYETWSVMRVREKVVERSFGKMKGRVMFPSSHDIIDIPGVRDACFRTLEKLLESGNEVLVTTKPRFSIVQQIDRLFGNYRNSLQFRFTITSLENRLLRFWEPGAPQLEERMDCLKYAFEKEYRTSVSVEPFLDRKPKRLVRLVEPYCTESVWIGKMNYIPSNSSLSENLLPFYTEIRANCSIDHLRWIYDDLKDRPKVRFKDSITILLRDHECI